MQNLNYWEKFEKSGSIADYLNYKNLSEDFDNGNSVFDGACDTGKESVGSRQTRVDIDG